MQLNDERSMLIGVSPFAEPHAALVVAVARAGALGVLDLGRDATLALSSIADVCRWWPGTFGVRVGPGCPLAPSDLPENVDTVVLAAGAPWDRAAAAARFRVFLEVTSVGEAIEAGTVAGRTAITTAGIIARGNEGGGRVSPLTTFVLLQQLLADPRVTMPVWAAGGIGLHTAAAAIAGGAAGVVLDTQLALVPEVELPEEVTAALRVMDGSETTLVDGHRVYTRPGLPAPDLADLGARHLRALPVGQDGPSARALADRYGTAGAVVSAVRASIGEHLRAAVAAEPLAEGSPFAAAAGLRYPIVQGPMTRVSDRAAFADAVADGGALPFLALALMSGPEVRALLTETAARLAGRPWGVGILGFVTPEIRAAQLEAVLAVRPPFALIAGGRPAQADPLEAAGIATFLHVPSPGLLQRFLADGARSFVFEGRECGGHVGPRTSFALWDAQISGLLAFGESAGEGYFAELRVLFAGGVHDARSAAMVAAMAAPLAALGAQVGVLMGTAYVFTDEAVQAGAVLPGFQRAALDCERTVLLETSPGHAVRCADSPFVEAFAAAKERLADTPPDEAWAELERLNIGRLRIASKGLVREGEELVAVDSGTQQRDGMFMLGEVAALRSRPTTVAALHEEVSAGGTAFLADRVAPAPSAVPATPLDIAIVGMAGIFGASADLGAYWSAVLAGADAVTEVPADRWDTGRFHATAGPGGTSPSKWGGFLPDVPFDALAYGIPPSSLASIEPVQLLALEVSARALADAGYDRRPFDRTRTAVIFGAEAGTDLSGAYGFRSVYPTYCGDLPPELDAQLPPLTEDSFPGVLANIIAGRVANRLNLGGANYTVDAACASSLAALDAACKELRTGAADTVLCGGADTHNGLHDYLLFASVHALSATGRCRPFDSTADGIALGEGVGVLVLKRLADAERDGDRIYAVIKGVGAASDGRSLGLTAPRPEGQRLALERAYGQAGVDPADVGLLEAHGTGTVVGDRTELATLTEMFAGAGADPGSCTLGSVKSQIGHTKCAAGLAGLIKAARALYTGVRPPTLHVSDPNPYWDAATSPFTFEPAARPWITPPAGRAAGVSAFGFGGTNFHAVLTAYASAPEPTHGLDEWPAELFTVRDLSALAALIDANDAAGRPWRLRDLARTTAALTTGPLVCTIVADDLDDLATKLDRARRLCGLLALRHAESANKPGTRGEPADGVFPVTGADAGRIAFLFPGQGSQRPGMLGDLFVAFPRLQRHLHAGAQWAELMFPPAARGAAQASAQRAALTDTRVAQPALGIAGLAAHELLGSLGVRPDLAAGHSYGELVALTVAGALSPADLLPLSAARGAAILAATGEDPGTMAAVAAAPEELADLPGVVVANRNAPRQTVISGPTAAVEAAIQQLAADGISAQRLAVACAFHSPVVAGAAQHLRGELAGIAVRAPQFDVYSNTTAEPYPADASEIAALLARQVAEPVRFVEQIEAMYAAGARTFVEAGPGRVLTQLVGKILGDRPHTAVALDSPREPGVRRLLLGLAELAAAGVAVDPGALFRGRDARVVSVRDVPRRPGWLVNGHLVRTVAGEYLPGGLRPARPVQLAAPVSASGDAAVLEFLRISRELVAAQRDVLLAHLGAGHAVPAAAPAPPQPVVIEAEPVPAALEPEKLTREHILATVLAIVSERTGYPLDMLDPDLDLEADLSIDSIKRTEVLGELTDRIGLGRGAAGGIDEAAVEQLARLKTLRKIVDWLVARTGQAQEEPALPLRRFVPHIAVLAAPAAAPLAGRRYVLLEDGLGVGLELADQLRAAGAKAELVGSVDDVALRDADALVHLTGLDPAAPPVLPDGFAALRTAALSGVRELLVVTGCGGRFGYNGAIDTAGAATGAGLHGLVRTLHQELGELRARALDLNPKDEPARLAGHIVAELRADAAPVVVGYADGIRATLELVVEELPAGDPGELGLRPDSVVLLTGGARGITAQVALGLARASGCHIELVGRTPRPSVDEDPTTASARDRLGLRRALIASGVTVPAQVEAAASRILAEREIRATLAELAGVAASVRYHSVDVRDTDAVTALVASVYAEHGRLDGVVHGAGVLEDRLLGDKTPESFQRVWSTKVDGARALAAAVRADLGFLVLFGSVSGVFGNPGQIDYAAANDALDTLARTSAHRFGGRVVSVDWGPWQAADGGMVSPDLQKQYAERGVGVIAAGAGVDALIGELTWGGPDTPQVVYLCGSPAAFERR